MTEWLYKRLSVGISFGLITAEEQIKLFDKYSDYIHDVYFSPTESINLQTRLNIYDFQNTSNEKRQQELGKVLQFVKKRGIKISVVLNASMSAPEYMVELLDIYQKRYTVDSVTTTTPVASLIKQTSIQLPIVCSYNEGICSLNDLLGVIDSGLFNSVVLGNSFIRDFNAFSIIKKHGLLTILLVNNGCSFGCTNFCHSNKTDYCKNLFLKRLSDCKDANKLYAQQSLFPEELFQYYSDNPNMDIFKLSCRPITYKEYENLFDSYVSGNSKEFIEATSRNYHLYARLGLFRNYYKVLDYNAVLMQKEYIWGNNINGNNTRPAL